MRSEHVQLFNVFGFYITKTLIMLSSIRLPFQDEFFSQVLVIVKRKKTYQLVIDEGWYSEGELEELGWSKPYT